MYYTESNKLSPSSLSGQYTCAGRRFLPMLSLLLGLGAAQMAAADTIHAIGVENQYANVISQIGGKYVQVSAIESNPNTDPIL